MGSPKHHYVPQCLLRGFSVEAKRTHVWVYDKRTDKVYKSAIADAAAESNFNTVTVNGQRVSFEGFFQTYDDSLALLLAEIGRVRDLVRLDHESLLRIPLLVACQIVRTKIARTSVRSFAEQLRNHLALEGIEVANPPPLLSEEDLRRQGAAALESIPRIANSLSRLEPILL